ncbi:hypothetical protein SAY86_010042 [Trapa natans]|uniref:GDSL esterase/lipase n=1 Tax=Trapa natans TaxID=22666 RepID=A0AAN7KX27_TRANT|nr:hypothetical protein SAY86_010042 [Trapa natans]
MKLRRVSVNWVLVILLAVGRGGEGDIVAAAEVLSSPPCQFPAIYNFGDSDSDTGGISAAFYPAGSPSGETYFGRPSGRGSDGRLMIDFICK